MFTTVGVTISADNAKAPSSNEFSVSNLAPTNKNFPVHALIIAEVVDVLYGVSRHAVQPWETS
jgi:hypothetical protein